MGVREVRRRCEEMMKDEVVMEKCVIDRVVE